MRRRGKLGRSLSTVDDESHVASCHCYSCCSRAGPAKALAYLATGCHRQARHGRAGESDMEIQSNLAVTLPVEVQPQCTVRLNVNQVSTTFH